MKLLSLAALAAATLLSSAAFSAGAQTFSECPAVGADTHGCEFLINVTGPATFVVATASPDQGPYDGSDDTLVGIFNSSKSTVKSIHLSSMTDIFGFDGDGACAAISAGSCDATGYGGPGVTFSNYLSNADMGDVNFAGGLAPGASAWFSLEEKLTASDIGTPGPPPTGTPTSVTPEPSSLMLLGTGIMGTAGIMRRRLFSRG